jgi:hypothetical protein
MLNENIKIYHMLWLAITAKYMDVLTTIVGVKIYGLTEFNPLGVEVVIIGSAVSIICFYIVAEIVRKSDRQFIKPKDERIVYAVLNAYMIILFTIALSNIMHIILTIRGYS